MVHDGEGHTGAYGIRAAGHPCGPLDPVSPIHESNAAGDGLWPAHPPRATVSYPMEGGLRGGGMRRTWRAVALLSILILVLAACGKKNTPTGGPTSAAGSPSA